MMQKKWKKNHKKTISKKVIKNLKNKYLAKRMQLKVKRRKAKKSSFFKLNTIKQRNSRIND